MRIVVPLPVWAKVPLPLIALERVTLSPRLMTRAPLLVRATAPVPREPTVLPLPTCRVPPLMVVAP